MVFKKVKKAFRKFDKWQESSRQKAIDRSQKRTELMKQQLKEANVQKKLKKARGQGAVYGSSFTDGMFDSKPKKRKKKDEFFGW